MPSGKIHDKIAFYSIIPAFLGCKYLFGLNIAESSIVICASIFSQLMFGPDLDVKSLQYKRWGILKWIWLPYKMIFAHRSSASHGIIVGPILRCLYFSCVMAFLVLFTSVLIEKYTGLKLLPLESISIRDLIDFTELLLKCDETKLWFSGIFLGAAIHTLSDKTASFFKNLL